MNKFTEHLERLQKELHYSNTEMANAFAHLYEEERKETLRLMKRNAKIRRFKLIGR